MPERPLLALPQPHRRAPIAGRPPIENVPSVAPGRQVVRLGPKFERLERALPDPAALAGLREDPTAIVPERALVFEVASNVVNFYRAVRGVPGLEFLGEDEGEAPSDTDFLKANSRDFAGPGSTESPVTVRINQLINHWRPSSRLRGAHRPWIDGG
jgi:hypothetical protein